MQLTEIQDEAVKVYEWRYEWLRAGGFNKRNARILAESPVPWRFAVDCLKHAKAKGYDEKFVMDLLL